MNNINNQERLNDYDENKNSEKIIQLIQKMKELDKRMIPNPLRTK